MSDKENGQAIEIKSFKKTCFNCHHGLTSVILKCVFIKYLTFFIEIVKKCVSLFLHSATFVPEWPFSGLFMVPKS